jgi:hypothetical protein
MTDRRFPPPWTVEDAGACFVVKDSGGQKLGSFYYEEEAGRRSAAKMLTKDEAGELRLTWRSSRSYCGSPSDHTALGGVMKHLTSGMSELTQIW